MLIWKVALTNIKESQILNLELFIMKWQGEESSLPWQHLCTHKLWFRKPIANSQIVEQLYWATHTINPGKALPGYLKIIIYHMP